MSTMSPALDSSSLEASSSSLDASSLDPSGLEFTNFSSPDSGRTRVYPVGTALVKRRVRDKLGVSGVDSIVSADFVTLNQVGDRVMV